MEKADVATNAFSSCTRLVPKNVLVSLLQTHNSLSLFAQVSWI